MTPVEFITALFYEIDEQLRASPTHPEAHLWPSEGGTLGLLQALKSGGNRAFYRGLTRDYRALCPRLPERTRLLRLFRPHQDWTQTCLAAPTVRGVLAPYGIEVIPPRRAGRSPQQMGRQGLSPHRWMVGGTLCLGRNPWGLGGAWACETAQVAENPLPWLMRPCDGRMIIVSATGFHAAEGAPANLKLCPRGAGQDRLLVAPVRSMLPLGCHFTRAMQRVWASFQARLACTMAAGTVLVQWQGRQPNASGCVPLSMAEFRL